MMRKVRFRKEEHNMVRGTRLIGLRVVDGGKRQPGIG